jgi:ABC-2 type transport system ATP-binding protein
LKTLNQETFILDLDTSLPNGWALPGFSVLVSKDASTIEVEVIKGQSINAIFQALDAISVNVVSMRNKSNRLEELFVKLIKG